VLSEEGEIPQVIEALGKGSKPLLRTLQLQNDTLENGTVAVLARVIGMQRLQGLSSKKMAQTKTMKGLRL
jgi:hypothetical protein